MLYLKPAATTSYCAAPLPGVARPRVAAHAVQRQHPDALGPVGAVGRDHAALAGGDVLHGVEAEGGEIGGRADAPRSGGRAERVRGVVDDRQAVARGDAAEADQRRRTSGEVHRQERRGARRHRGLGRGRIEVQRGEVDVGQHRRAAGVDDRVDRRAERVGAW